MPHSDEHYLRIAIDIARRARASGNHPFGALLVGDDGDILLEAENTVITARDCTGHAETNLMRLASARFGLDILSRCTLYTSTEPCAMCSGAIYWGEINRVVYGLSEAHLYAITGSNPENLVLALPCREIFQHGQRAIEVIGPLLEEEARVVHLGFWE